MMKKFVLALVISMVFTALALPGGTAVAADKKHQRMVGALSELKKDPRYRGRILGTHLRRGGGGNYVYEVRILTPDDRILLVYVDPKTGRVIRDSGGSRNWLKREKTLRGKRK